MNEAIKNGNNFIGYEYKDITVSHDMESLYTDSYGSFGWELENASSPFIGISTVTMKFKRDRKIRNKAELTRLQRQFDALIGEIEALDRSKVINASIGSYSVGIAGAAFMAGSVFAFLAGMLPLCIILAVPAFAGWIIPYFMYLKIIKRKTEKVTPLIDAKYDEIYGVCEKANGLLAN